MGYYSILMYHNQDNISTEVLSYERNVEMCSGVGTLNIALVDSQRNYEPWDVITLYEYNIKKGTYFINEIKHDRNTGVVQLGCQDGSKKLQDFFIDESENSEEGDTSLQWAVHYISAAGITATVDSGRGVPLAPDSALGMTNAYEQVMQLLQYGGQYMYFDANNVCHVGAMKRRKPVSITLRDNIITTIEINSDDEMLRNRAVVLGMATGGEQIKVVLTVHLPWNYDTKDIRSVVMANSYIYSESIAKEIANKLLDEFAELTVVKTITTGIPLEVSIGDGCKIDSKYYHYPNAKVTTVQSKFNSKDGLSTTLILDEKCPRLFAFWEALPEDEEFPIFVYTGHDGDGVYRKQLVPSGGSAYFTGSDIFHDFSEGLDDNKYISDLRVSNYLGALVAGDGYVYSRKIDIIGSGAWEKVDHGDFVGQGDIVYSGDTVRAKAVSIGKDELGQTYILAGYNYRNENETAEISSGVFYTPGKSWITRIDPEDKKIIEIEQVTLSGGITDVNIEDVEVYNGKTDLVTISGGYIPASGVFFNTGYRENQDYITAVGKLPYDSNITNAGIAPGTWEADPPKTEILDMFGVSSPIIDKYNPDIVYVGSVDYDRLGYLHVVDLTTMNDTIYNFTIPDTEFLGADYANNLYVYIHQISTTVFDIIFYKLGTTGHDTISNVYYIRYDMSSESIISTSYNTVYGTKFINGVFIDDRIGSFSAPILRSNISNIVGDEWKESCYYLGYVKAVHGNGNTMLAKLWEVRTEVLMAMGGWIPPFGGKTYRIKKTSIVATTTANPTYGTTLASWDYGAIGVDYGEWGWIQLRTVAPFELHQRATIDQTGNASVLLEFTLKTMLSAWSGEESTCLFGLSIKNSISNASVIYGYDGWISGTNPVFTDKRFFHVDGRSKITNLSSKWYTGNTIWQTLDFKYNFQDSNFNIVQSIDIASLFPGATSTALFCHNISDIDGATYIAPVYSSGPYQSAKRLHGVITGTTDRSINFNNNWFRPFLLGNNLGTITVGYPYGGIDLFIYPSGDWTLKPDYMYLDPKVIRHTISGEATPSEFVTLLNLEATSQVERDGITPILVWDIPSGVGEDSIALNTNPMAEPTGWVITSPGMALNDVRGFKTRNPDNFVVVSGNTNDQYEWALVATVSGIQAFPATISGEPIVIATFDENVTHVEASNKSYVPGSGSLTEDIFSTYPIILASLENPGVILDVPAPASGIFWQRLPGDTNFKEDSTGLPLSKITIIRLDDDL